MLPIVFKVAGALIHIPVYGIQVDAVFFYTFLKQVVAMRLLIVFLSIFIISSCADETAISTPDISVAVEHTDYKKFSAPSNTPILTISGNLNQYNHQNELRLDRDQLLSFKQVTLKTTTLWTDGESTFTGPLVREILAAVGSKAKTISAIAINEYAVDIPVTDLEKFPVIFAIQQNGVALSIRERGPIWVMYPWDSDAQLKQDKYYSRSIWQLDSIKIND